MDGMGWVFWVLGLGSGGVVGADVEAGLSERSVRRRVGDASASAVVCRFLSLIQLLGASDASSTFGSSHPIHRHRSRPSIDRPAALPRGGAASFVESGRA